MDDYVRLSELSRKERRELNKLLRKQKKRLSSIDTYIILFNANKKEFVERLSKEERQWLYNRAKGETECLRCPCFAWEFDENNRTIGCICTLGGNPNWDGKGECPHDKPEEGK
jgi:hypothetical protein